MLCIGAAKSYSTTMMKFSLLATTLTALSTTTTTFSPSLHNLKKLPTSSTSINAFFSDGEPDKQPPAPIVRIPVEKNNDSKLFVAKDSKLFLLWKRQLQWNEVSKAKKADLDFWRRINLFLTIVGAFISAYATQIDGDSQWIAAIIGSALLACVPLIKTNFLSPKQVDEFVRCKSTAAFMKSELYLYRLRVKPYSKDLSDNKNVRILTDRFAQLREAVQDLKYLFALQESTVIEMIKKWDDDDGIDGDNTSFTYQNNISPEVYIEERLEVEYKRLKSKSKSLAREGLFLSFWQYTFGTLAALVGFLAGTTDGSTGGGAVSSYLNLIPGNLGIWAPVFTTAAATMSSYLSEQQHYEFSALYIGAAQKLEDLRLYLNFDEASRKKKGFAQSWEEFVLECEAAILAENIQWKNVKSSEDEEESDKDQGITPFSTPLPSRVATEDASTPAVANGAGESSDRSEL